MSVLRGAHDMRNVYGANDMRNVNGANDMRQPRGAHDMRDVHGAIDFDAIAATASATAAATEATAAAMAAAAASASATATANREADIAWLARRLPELKPELRRATRAQLAQLRKTGGDVKSQATKVCMLLDLAAPHWTAKPDTGSLPLLALLPSVGVCIVFADAGRNDWRIETAEGAQRVAKNLAGALYAPLVAIKTTEDCRTAEGLFRAALRQQRPAFVAAAAASLLANVIALAGSLYSMQVYDRVIPTQGLSTLTVLTFGALVACVFELVVKLARSSILEASVRKMDLGLSHAIFKRLTDIRIDQLPPSVGSLSAQVRSYESIRGFASAITMYAAVDAPFGLLFLGVMWMLAGVELVAVPAVFFVVAMAVGLMYRARIAAHAKTASAAANRKAGLLVETIENAETIKADGTGWSQSAKWNALSRSAIDDELKIRHYSESSQYFAAFVQQVSYIVMIGVGAYIASTSTSLTTGGLIACSILSGRVLGPIGMLPGLIVQWAHARSALANLERIFALESDNAGVAQPLAPAVVGGAFRLEDVKFAYPNRPATISVAKLCIASGEKVAILGPVGAGKSTLLKVIAGLYKPQQGRVLLDGLEIQQIARDHVAQHVGYLAQDMRLVAGTLRENLTAGVADADEALLLSACEATGLSALIASHPKGLELEIGEGGTGVSGGQRRLVGLTRLVLAKPSVWLLDEPTSAMDETTERRSLALLQRSMTPQQTLVLVTHKPQLLALVDRIVVMTHEGVAMDGPRDAVLQALANNGRPVQKETA